MSERLAGKTDSPMLIPELISESFPVPTVLRLLRLVPSGRYS
jgi:hypothetical protein